MVRDCGHLFCGLIAVISAVDYFIGFWKEIDHASKDAARLPCSPAARA